MLQNTILNVYRNCRNVIKSSIKCPTIIRINKNAIYNYLKLSSYFSFMKYIIETHCFIFTVS